MKTFSPRPRDIERRWYVIDAEGAVLGRLASEVAKLLRGKHKPIFAPHADTGDHVIVINARGVRVTGGKEEKKIYYRHSGYPGGLRETRYTTLLADRPTVAVEKAIRGMLPKNRLGRQMATKLAVYEGPDHPHQAQKPVVLGLGDIPKWEGLPEPKPKPAPKVRQPKKAPPGKDGAESGPAKSLPKAATGRAKAPTGRSSAGSASKASPKDAPTAKSTTKRRSPRRSKTKES